MVVEPHTLSRRSFAKLGAVLGLTAGFEVVYATAGAARIASAAELEETDTVIVGVYSGDWETNINTAALDDFADETDLDVIVVAGADAEWLTKLQAAQGRNVSYDLLVLQPDSIQKLQEAALLQPIGTDEVPNVADFATSINDRFTVDGELYAAGFSMGQLGIAYRTDLVSNPPASWADLWSDEYAGKLGVSPLTYSAGLQFFWALTQEGTDVDGAFERLEELKPNIVAYPDGAGTLQTLILRGDIAVVPFWDGRVFAWQEQDQPIGFVYPEEGAVAAIASWVIPVGAPNLANAYRLLDYLSSPEVQGAYAELSYYGMANELTEYSDAFLEKASVGGEAYDELSWVDYTLATPNLTEWSNRWTEVLG